MGSFTTGHPPWRRLLIISVGLTVVIAAAVLAFAWSAARTAPRDLPLGVVGTGPASQQVVDGLDRTRPGAFDLHLYADAAAARTAIRHRQVYGAVIADGRGITVLEASAASPTVAQLLTQLGQGLARQAGASTGRPVAAHTLDVVPTATADPRGAVLSSVLLPLTICSVLVATGIALAGRFRPAWAEIAALLTTVAATSLGAYLVAQTFLGALPHHHLATWATLALLLMAVSATVTGMIALVGPGGVAAVAPVLLFIANPFSGSTSAPELLPTAVGHIGQWLPPGAGVDLLRSVAYFDGHGSAGPLTVLLLWAAGGLLAIVAGHHTSRRFAAHPERAEPTAHPRHLYEVG